MWSPDPHRPLEISVWVKAQFWLRRFKLHLWCCFGFIDGVFNVCYMCVGVFPLEAWHLQLRARLAFGMGEDVMA